MLFAHAFRTVKGTELRTFLR